MTRPKNQALRSEKRVSLNGCRTVPKVHTISPDEVNQWFRVWGIIGEKREAVPYRVQNVYERGPGL